MGRAGSQASTKPNKEIMIVEVPKLGKEAAEKAIKEWGQSKSKITHLVFCTTSGVDVPGADFQLTKLLGLEPSVKRFMMYQQGCFGGGTALRLAKDLAENNKGARVLVVCSELANFLCLRSPNEMELDVLVGQSLFSDGASSVIIGSDPITFQPLDISDWNSIFWVSHPGGRAILDQIEFKLGLNPEKLKASRNVLSDYGNMASACVLFVLDEMRKTSITAGLGTTGEGLEWGVLFGFGPGLTVEAIVLRSVSV